MVSRILPSPSKLEDTIEMTILRCTRKVSEHLLLDHPQQRAIAWTNKKWQSDFIAAILTGQPIPSFIYKRSSDGHYINYDGKNRINAIRKFMNDDFHLTKCDYIPEELVGKKYSTLSSEYQLLFRNSKFLIYVYPHDTPDELLQGYLQAMNKHKKPHSEHELQKRFASSVDEFLKPHLPDFYQTPIYIKTGEQTDREQGIINLKIALALLEPTFNIESNMDKYMTTYIPKKFGEDPSEIEKNLKAKSKEIEDKLKLLVNICKLFKSCGNMYEIHGEKFSVKWKNDNSSIRKARNQWLFLSVCATAKKFENRKDLLSSSVIKKLTEEFVKFISEKQICDSYGSVITSASKKQRRMFQIVDEIISKIIADDEDDEENDH